MLGSWKKQTIEFPEIEKVLLEDPRPTFVDSYQQDLLQRGRALKALISDINWKIGPEPKYDWDEHVGVTLLFDVDGKRHRRKHKLSYSFGRAGNQNPEEHTHWFKRRIKQNEFVTILFPEEDPRHRGDLTLFGQLMPFVSRSFTELLERFRADGSSSYNLLSPLLDILHNEFPNNQALKEALRGVAGLYTNRGRDDFYIVGDLHHAFRTKKISSKAANKVLNAVKSTVETATIPRWVAD